MSWLAHATRYIKLLEQLLKQLRFPRWLHWCNPKGGMSFCNHMTGRQESKTSCLTHPGTSALTDHHRTSGPQSFPHHQMSCSVTLGSYLTLCLPQNLLIQALHAILYSCTWQPLSLQMRGKRLGCTLSQDCWDVLSWASLCLHIDTLTPGALLGNPKPWYVQNQAFHLSPHMFWEKDMSDPSQQTPYITWIWQNRSTTASATCALCPAATAYQLDYVLT